MTRIGINEGPIPALSGPGGLGGQQTSPVVVGSICDIADVDCTYLADGDVLIWNGYAWTASPISTNPVDDVAAWMPLTTVMDGEPVLVWDGDNGLIPTLVPF